MSNQRFEELCSIAGPVSRETYEMLLRFENTFLKWNQRINLSAPSTLEATWQRHILDSAQLLAIEPQARQWLDIGSGGGFPGLIVAFLLRERGGSVDLVESNRKKTGFLQAMVGEFGLPARVHARRIEDVYSLVQQPQIVTARALAPLPLLLDLAAPWLTSGAHGLFHKGRDYRLEVEESAHHWNFDLVEHASTVDPQGVVLEIRNLRKM
ncbi:MAG: 16S rRNA (guanine(527)-N(7))-methyltransferase RsmG [Mesorhizobium sp.]|nr:16S rRNA (guanine(527)-N(7))-methyltransferase RsmG [Mesorhizobium sp.]